MSKHDKIATRISLILTKLNNGEKLSVKDLSKEFGVTKRTIQRDLNERLINIPIQKEGDVYSLEAHYLGQLTFDDINNFAIFSGIKQMFPSLNTEVVNTILDKDAYNPYLIKGHNYENLTTTAHEFKLIEKAIIDSKMIELLYKEQQRQVHPYKLANVKGIWYLVALQEGVIKTFTLSKISNLNSLNRSFSFDEKILSKIENEDSLWFSNKKTEVILKVHHSIAQYFKRRKTLAYQKILEEDEDGSLLISTQMTFEEEVLQIVRYWIPNIHIISPMKLQKKLEESLESYTKETKNI